MARSQKRIWKRLFFFGVPLVLLCLFLAGCVHQRQYRKDFSEASVDKTPHSEIGPVVEVSPYYTLGYVEFDDQGWQYGDGNGHNRSQLDFVLSRFGRESKTNGLLMVAYVHGWKHNASPGDSNVVMFSQMLERMGRVEDFLSKRQKRPARRVAGVYIGWRGLSSDVEPFKEMSFWSRKSADEQVGHGAVVETLSELEALRDANNRLFAKDIKDRSRLSTKLLIIGHSFGGDIVYSAVAPILKERMVENYNEAGDTIPPQTLGDLVVLINPAFEASRFETIERLASQKQFPAVTNCVLAVFTSTADWATGFFFPLGRRVSTFFDAYTDKAQGKANITAVGHYQPYINYDLLVRDSSKKEIIAQTNDLTSTAASATNVMHLTEQIQRTARRLRSGAGATSDDLTFTFTHVALSPRTNAIRQDPVFNVAVDPQIIPDHDTFNRPIFTRFLTEFLAAFSGSGD